MAQTEKRLPFGLALHALSIW